MPYNSKGEWEDEDAGVQTRVAGMLNQESPLMKAARTEGLKAGNRRGLLNSTMAAQTGTRAALDVVVPIASQEAGQVHARNLSGQGYRQEGMLQAPRIASQEKIVGIQEAGAEKRLGMEIGSREKIAGEDRASRSADLLRELTSREGISAADRTARSGDIRAELGSRENIAGREITSREGIAGRELTSREGMLGRELSSREGIAREDRTARSNDVAAELTSRETIARDDRAATTQTAVANAVGTANTTYTNTYNAIVSNPNIPADQRGAMLEGLENRHNADIVLIEGLYSVDLDWPTGEEQPAAPAAPAAPAVPTYPTQPYPEENWQI